jgi:NADH-quinone oxidoreductase subunit G
MLQVKINNIFYILKQNISILEACKLVGFLIPRFCYHEILSVAGNCRMCLVEINASPKPVAACAFPLINKMQIRLNTPLVRKARENVLEALLLHHPLDCPICDQAGECDLQDQAQKFGTKFSRYYSYKKPVEDKLCSVLITTIMTRCIKCTRCTRFSTEILGISLLGTINRGHSTEISSYTKIRAQSELSGNLIDLCPVGALTAKTYAFKTRPWEVKVGESLDLTDSAGASILVTFKHLKVIKIIPKIVSFTNNLIISDRARFFFDALNFQRLYKAYHQSNNKKQEIYAINYLKKLEVAVKLKQIVLILLIAELDLIILSLLESVSLKYQQIVNIRVVKMALSNLNFMHQNINKFNSLSRVQTVLFVSTNLRLESSVLNNKIRTKFLAEDLLVFNTGLNLSNSSYAQHLNLNINYFLFVAEGKVNTFQYLLVKIAYPLFILGESLTFRGSSINTLINFLKRIKPNALFFMILECCNSFGTTFLNFRKVTRKNLIFPNFFFLFNLISTVHTAKLIQQMQGKRVWFGTHGSLLLTKMSTLIPILTIAEEDGIFINTEGKPQRSFNLFESSCTALSLTGIVHTIFKALVPTTYNNFLYDLAKAPGLFFKPLFFKFFYPAKDLSNRMQLYPAKPNFSDPYLTGSMAKYSVTMAKCSKRDRGFNFNFR